MASRACLYREASDSYTHSQWSVNNELTTDSGNEAGTHRQPLYDHIQFALELLVFFTQFLGSCNELARDRQRRMQDAGCSLPSTLPSSFFPLVCGNPSLPFLVSSTLPSEAVPFPLSATLDASFLGAMIAVTAVGEAGMQG